MRRIVVEVSGRQIDRLAGHADRIERDEGRRTAERSAAAIAPFRGLGIPPHAIGADELGDVAAMWSPASLAPAASAHEPDKVGNLRPVDRVEPTVLRADRHGSDSDSFPPRTKVKKLGLKLLGLFRSNLPLRRR